MNEVKLIKDNFGMRKKLLNQTDIRGVHISDNMFHTRTSFFCVSLEISLKRG